uniref:Uncharacterized protein n=1 Tax=Anguilla anguilla TaxID=7936 RepID=A0A0E9R704_ANGAN
MTGERSDSSINNTLGTVQYLGCYFFKFDELQIPYTIK